MMILLRTDPWNDNANSNNNAYYGYSTPGANDNDLTWSIIKKTINNGILINEYPYFTGDTGERYFQTSCLQWNLRSSYTYTVMSASPTLSVLPTSQSISSISGTTTFNISSNSDWIITSDQPSWSFIPSSGNGDQIITVTYPANTIFTQRIANITTTVTGLDPVIVTITQDALIHTLSVSPTSTTVSGFTGTTNFNILSNSNWSASCDQVWCSLNPSSSSGNGNLIATFSQSLLNVEQKANGFNSLR